MNSTTLSPCHPFTQQAEQSRAQAQAYGALEHGTCKGRYECCTCLKRPCGRNLANWLLDTQCCILWLQPSMQKRMTCSAACIPQAIWQELSSTVHAVDSMVTQTPAEAGLPDV